MNDMKDEELKSGTEGRGVSDLNCLLAPREIKFRGMDIYGNWHYGFLSKSKGLAGQPKVGYYISNKVGQPWAYHVIRQTVSQFTGLKDKNGKEIYEGDIVRRLSLRSEYQDHYLEDSYFREQIDTKMKWIHKLVEFKNGYFTVADPFDEIDLGPELDPKESILNVFGLPSKSDGQEALDYLKREGFEFNSLNEVAKAHTGLEVIGNIFENSELLE